MEPVLRSLTLHRFRSVENTRLDFANPTFLVGKNGSGKSNLCDAIAFLSELTQSPLGAVMGRRGGIHAVWHRDGREDREAPLALVAEFGALAGDKGEDVASARYAFALRRSQDRPGAHMAVGFWVLREQCVVHGKDGTTYWFDRKENRLRSNWFDGEPLLDGAALALPVIGGTLRFAPVLRAMAAMRVYAIEPAKLRDFQDAGGATTLARDGGNAAVVLQALARDDSRTAAAIDEALACIVPETSGVHVDRYGNKLVLMFTQRVGASRSVTFDASSMSDGTLRALGVLAAVYQQPAPSVVVIEEPEATIHPGALAAILDVLKEATLRTQLVLTTHSPDLLDAKWIQPEHLRMVSWRDGATRVSPVGEMAHAALREHLMVAGELLRSNALQPSDEAVAETTELFQELS